MNIDFPLKMHFSLKSNKCVCFCFWRLFLSLLFVFVSVKEVFGINGYSSSPSFRTLQNQRVINITVFMYNQYFRLLCGIVYEWLYICKGRFQNWKPVMLAFIPGFDQTSWNYTTYKNTHDKIWRVWKHVCLIYVQCPIVYFFVSMTVYLLNMSDRG